MAHPHSSLPPKCATISQATSVRTGSLVTCSASFPCLYSNPNTEHQEGLLAFGLLRLLPSVLDNPLTACHYELLQVRSFVAADADPLPSFAHDVFVAAWECKAASAAGAPGLRAPPCSLPHPILVHGTTVAGFVAASPPTLPAPPRLRASAPQPYLPAHAHTHAHTSLHAHTQLPAHAHTHSHPPCMHTHNSLYKHTTPCTHTHNSPPPHTHNSLHT